MTDRPNHTPEFHGRTPEKTIRNLGRACNYVDKVLADVPLDYPGRYSLELLHFYGYYYEQTSEPSRQLIETLEHITLGVEMHSEETR